MVIDMTPCVQFIVSSGPAVVLSQISTWTGHQLQNLGYHVQATPLDRIWRRPAIWDPLGTNIDPPLTNLLLCTRRLNWTDH